MKNLLRFILLITITFCSVCAYKSTIKEPKGTLFCDRVWNRLAILPVEATPYRLNLEEKFFNSCGTYEKYQSDEVIFISY